MTTDHDQSGGRSRKRSQPRSGREHGEVSRFHPSMIIACALVWVLLWGDLSIANLIIGALLGLLIGLIFPLPAVPELGRLRPVGLLRLLIVFAVDLVRSSVAVMITVLRFGYRPHNAIVGVDLRTRSDLYLTQTAELVSLVPGTLVVEARRSTSTLYVHVLDSTGPEDLEQARRIVLDAEARVIRAFGRSDEIAALNAGEPMPGVPTETADRPARGERR